MEEILKLNTFVVTYYNFHSTLIQQSVREAHTKITIGILKHFRLTFETLLNASNYNNNNFINIFLFYGKVSQARLFFCSAKKLNLARKNRESFRNGVSNSDNRILCELFFFHFVLLRLYIDVCIRHPMSACMACFISGTYVYSRRVGMSLSWIM